MHDINVLVFHCRIHEDRSVLKISMYSTVVYTGDIFFLVKVLLIDVHVSYTYKKIIKNDIKNIFSYERNHIIFWIWIWICHFARNESQKTQDWINVEDSGPTLNQHWFNVLCLPRYLTQCRDKILDEINNSVKFQVEKQANLFILCTFTKSKIIKNPLRCNLAKSKTLYCSYRYEIFRERPLNCVDLCPPWWHVFALRCRRRRSLASTRYSRNVVWIMAQSCANIVWTSRVCYERPGHRANKRWLPNDG